MGWFGATKAAVGINGDKKDKYQGAPAPTNLLGDLQPDDALQSRSNATAEAQRAAARARKRAALGGAPVLAPVAGTTAASAVLAPKTLGGY